MTILNDPQENKKLLAKLPVPLMEKWNNIVHKSLFVREVEDYDDGAMSITGNVMAQYPSFARFCKFMKTEADKTCNPISSYNAIVEKGQKNAGGIGKGKKESAAATTQIGSRSFLTETSENKKSETGESKSEGKNQNEEVKKQEIKWPYCTFCNTEHELDTCKKYNELQLEARLDFVNTSKLCRGCLKRGHISRQCHRKKMCTMCKRYHPTCLHNENLAQQANKRESGKACASKHESGKTDQKKDETSKAISNRIKISRTIIGDTHSMIVPVWVHLVSDVNNKRVAYALLHDQSDMPVLLKTAL